MFKAVTRALGMGARAAPVAASVVAAPARGIATAGLLGASSRSVFSSRLPAALSLSAAPLALARAPVDLSSMLCPAAVVADLTGCASAVPAGARGRKTFRTYQPSVVKRKRDHGFLHRLRSASGRRVLAARKAKGRWALSV